MYSVQVYVEQILWFYALLYAGYCTLCPKYIQYIQVCIIVYVWYMWDICVRKAFYGSTLLYAPDQPDGVVVVVADPWSQF